MIERTNTLIVGGGQAGLAMSEHLTNNNVDHIILERDRIVEKWRTSRWDSLVANGPSWHDRFPTMEFSDVEPNAFAHKDSVVNYFENFAKKINAPVRTNVEVQEVVKLTEEEGFSITTSDGIFEANNIHVVISSESFIHKCRDKRIIHDFFESKGVARAKEYTKDNFSLPLYIKPLDGSRSVDNYIIKSKSELREYHFENDKLMFLEYLDHNEYEEFTCDLYYDKKNALKCVVPRKRIEVRDGEVNKGLTLKNELIPYIKKHLSIIEGARGCLTAQFFMHKKNNSIYGIEINPRFGGGFPLSYLAGANFPKWLIQEYIFEEEVEENFNSWEGNLLMIRYDDEILVHGYKG